MSISVLQVAHRVGLKLEPFQLRILRAAAGRERELLVTLPRGNGKTALLALVALHHLLTVEDARVIVVAASRAQVEHLFRYADSYARELREPHLVSRYLTLRWCPDPLKAKDFSRTLEVWPSADPGKLHGLTYSLAIIDELQAQPKDGAYLAMASALRQAQRRQAGQHHHGRTRRREPARKAPSASAERAQRQPQGRRDGGSR